MGEILKNLSGLKKSMAIPAENPEPVVAPVAADGGCDAVDYFKRHDDGDAEEPDIEAAAYKEALAELAEEKVAAEERLRDCEKNLDSARRLISDLEREVERLAGDNARLRGEAKKRDAEAAADAVEPPPAAEVPRKGILDRPFGFEEMFTDEIREMLIASLSDYRKNIANGDYQRRLAVLDAVLAANGSSGELESRSEKLRQILKNAGYLNDPKPLEKLGFRLISGRVHWKLDYAGIRSTMAKTPSDYRSNSNSAAEIARRCF